MLYYGPQSRGLAGRRFAAFIRANELNAALPILMATQTRDFRSMPELPERIPFSLLDELFFHLDAQDSPFNTQLEVRLKAKIDGSRLSEALLTAMGLHPMMAARMASWESSDSVYSWLLPGLDRVSPLREVDCPDDIALQAVRSGLHSDPMDLTGGYPFRCVLAHTDDGDYLMLSASHAATDGAGLYRFMASILRAYAKFPDPQPELDLLAIRDLAGQLGSRNLRERLNRITRLLEILGTAITPPVRISPAGGGEAIGLGFAPVHFNREQTARLQALRQPDTTLNDVLQALLHKTIRQWNSDHGKPGGRISVMMPMNTREPDWRWEMATNLSLWVNVVSRADQGNDFDSLLLNIARQTQRLKERGTAGLLIDLLNDIRKLPLWLKQRLPALLPLTGHRVVDTTVLNNLGRLPPALPEGKGPAISELVFSSPCREPMGMSVGAATLDEQLRLSFRYSYQQFSDDGAWAFAELFLEMLQQQQAAQ